MLRGLIAASAALAAWFGVAWACSCGGVPPRSPIVVTATAEATMDWPPAPSARWGHHLGRQVTAFRINSVERGNVTVGQRLLVRHPVTMGACGYPFTPGVRYGLNIMVEGTTPFTRICLYEDGAPRALDPAP